MDYLVNITEIINTLANSYDAWLPTVISVGSIVATVFIGFARIKRACNDIRSDKTIGEMRDEMAQLRGEQQNQSATEKEMIRVVKRYLDETHKIRRNTNDENEDDYYYHFNDEDGEGRA